MKYLALPHRVAEGRGDLLEVRRSPARASSTVRVLSGPQRGFKRLHCGLAAALRSALPALAADHPGIGHPPVQFPGGERPLVRGAGRRCVFVAYHVCSSVCLASVWMWSFGSGVPAEGANQASG